MTDRADRRVGLSKAPDENPDAMPTPKKEAARRLMAAPPIRWVSKIALSLHRIGSRFVSAARTAALFPHAEGLVCHHSVEVKYPGRISFGRGVIIGPECTLGAANSIIFGDHVRLSKRVLVETAGLDFSGPPPYPHISKPIVLGDGVWVGAGSIILGGVTIGAGSVIGAGAVVAKNVAPMMIVTGQPSRQRPCPRVRE